jgi:hypothetical protein
MPQSDLFIAMGIGGLFILLGLAAMFWGRNEEKGYYNAISDRPDTREFLERWPQRPQFGALKIGGWIAIAVGVVLIVIGGAFWLWG